MPATIPIDSVLDRIRQGEPLRWVPSVMLGFPGRPKSQVLMLGGDQLSDDAWNEIDDRPDLIEQPTDSDGITPIQLFE